MLAAPGESNFEVRVKPAASKPPRQNKGRLLAWTMLIEFSEKKTYFVKVVVFSHWMGLEVESTTSEYQSDEGHSTVKGFQTVTALHQVGTSDENIYNFQVSQSYLHKRTTPTLHDHKFCSKAAGFWTIMS
jgi:hypothetical protein